MKEKNKKTLIVLLVSIVVVTITTSTAYMLMNILPDINDPQKMGVTTDKLVLSYTDCADNNRFHCENINKDLSLGESVVKTFQIKNESNNKMTYTLYFKHLQNTFKNDELIYKIENIDTGEIFLDTTPIPYREVKTANVTIKENIEIEGNTTQNYRMTVTFLDKNTNQNENLNAKYSIKLSIIPSNQELTESISNELMRVSWDYNEKMWQHKADIKKIVFEDSLASKENASYVYDISSAQNESVMSYLVPDAEDKTKYTAYIQSDGETVANKDSSNLFYNFKSLETIDNLKNLNTSNVTNMSYMFYNCSSLTALDVTNFDTSNVTSMSSMFSGCSSLTTLDVTNFDTSSVIKMGGMFKDCGSLTTLYVSNFNTSSVTSLTQMFWGCNNLTELNVSNFDTANVTNMYGMFFGCSNLTTLDVSHFDTSNVVDMGAMFNGCSSLTELNVSNFDTANITNMYGMFTSCRGLTELDVSNFDTNKVTSMGWMFQGCSSLTTLDLSNFNTSNVTGMSYMFNGCTNLTTLDVSNFNTRNVTNKDKMFSSIKLSINIIVKTQDLKQWVIEASISPKLTDSNFTII